MALRDRGEYDSTGFHSTKLNGASMSDRLKSVVLCLFLLAIPSPLRADDSDVQRIISAGQNGNKVMEDLDWLTNRIGPRLTSSDNLQDAVEWARDRFKEEGLDNARLEEWGEFPVGFNRGPWFGK